MTGAETNRTSNHDQDEAEEPVRALTREEAEALREKEPPVSMWRVVATQASAGILVAAIWWWVSGKFEGAVSALFGAAVITLPQALMAAGLGRTRKAAARTGPGGMVVGFMFWQFVKIGFAVLMLVSAGVLIKWISWPAVLVALIVCTQVNWLALLWRGRRSPQ